MEHGSTRCRARAVVLTGAVVALVAALTAAPAAARPSPAPTVDIQPAAGLAPDGRSITLQLLAECPERWSVVEAVVAVSQPQASGRASFPLVCIGSLRMFTVSVPSAGDAFELVATQVTASVVIKRGKTQRAEDSEAVRVQPLVLVELAESARLESGGGAVLLAVTVACPVQTTGVESRLVVSQGQAQGVGTYTPVCDGAPHTFAVRVEASRGVYQPGIAQALTFANVEFGGMAFYGIDDDGSLEIVG